MRFRSVTRMLLLCTEGFLVSQTNRGAQVGPRLPAALRRFFMALRTALETFALQIDGLSRLSEADFLRHWSISSEISTKPANNMTRQARP